MDNTTRENTPKVGTETVGHGDYPLTQKHCGPAAPAPKLPCIPLLKPDTPRDLSSYVPTATTPRGCPEWAGAARRPTACCRTKQGLAAWKDAIFPQPPPPPPPRVTATRPERDSASQQAADRQQAPGAQHHRRVSRAPHGHAAAAENRDPKQQQHIPTPWGPRSGPPRSCSSRVGAASGSAPTSASRGCVWRLRVGDEEMVSETEGAASGGQPSPMGEAGWLRRGCYRTWTSPGARLCVLPAAGFRDD